MSAIFILKERKWHTAVFNQTLRFYSVALLPYTVLIGLAVQRAVASESLNVPLNQMDFVIGGIFSLIILLSVFWLLLYPLFQYIQSTIKKRSLAFALLSFVLVGSWYIGGVLPFDVAEETIDRKALCKQIYRYKLEKGEIDNSLQISCFLGKCLDAQK